MVSGFEALFCDNSRRTDRERDFAREKAVRIGPNLMGNTLELFVW